MTKKAAMPTYALGTHMGLHIRLNMVFGPIDKMGEPQKGIWMKKQNKTLWHSAVPL